MVQPGAGAFAAIAVAALGGLTWQQAGVYRDQITFFSHIVSHNPTARSAHYNLAVALLDAGRIEEDLAATRIAREQRPDAPGPYATLGRALMEQGRLDEAAEALQRAIEVDPEHVGALQLWAELARKRGRIAEAEIRYREVLAIDQDHGLAHAGLGTVLFRQKALRGSARPPAFGGGISGDGRYPGRALPSTWASPPGNLGSWRKPRRTWSAQSLQYPTTL